MSSKISALTALTGAGLDPSADSFPVVDASATATKKITGRELRAGLGVVGVDVASYATGGDGSSGNPWTGWDSAITWTTQTRYDFRDGHYSHSGSTNFLQPGIELIGGSDTWIHATGTSYVLKMDASQVSSVWIQNARVENLKLQGNSSGTTKHGLFLVGCRNAIFKHITVKDVSDSAMWSEACVTNTLECLSCTYHEPTSNYGWDYVRPKYGIVLTRRGMDAGSPVSNDESTCWTIINPVIENLEYYGIWVRDIGAYNGFTRFSNGGFTSYGHTIINGTCEAMHQSVAGFSPITGTSYSTTSYRVTCADTSNLKIGMQIYHASDFPNNARVAYIEDSTHFYVDEKPSNSGSNNLSVFTPALGILMEGWYSSITNTDVEANTGNKDIMVTGSYNQFNGINSFGYSSILGNHNLVAGGKWTYLSCINDTSGRGYNNVFLFPKASNAFNEDGNTTLYTGITNSTRRSKLGVITPITQDGNSAPDASLYNSVRISPSAGTTTLPIPTNGTDGDEMTWLIYNTSGGAITLAVNASFDTLAGVTVPASVANNKAAIVRARYSGYSSKWHIWSAVGG